MHNQFIKNLLLLEDVTIEDIKHYQERCEVRISQPVRSHICPQCGSTTNKVHDYRFQVIKDIPFLNKPLRLYYRKRRYKCQHCHKRFYEQVNFVGRYQRMARRLIELDKVRKNLVKSLPYAKSKFIKNCKRLLLSHPNKLSTEGKMRIANILMLIRLNTYHPNI